MWASGFRGLQPSGFLVSEEVSVLDFVSFTLNQSLLGGLPR